jgi:hypothetical protein
MWIVGADVSEFEIETPKREYEYWGVNKQAS